MREQLIQYVNLLFAGTVSCEDVRQEILQNTLDRYDDLIRQGKTPESAYRLAISGIGDIGEILGTQQDAQPSAEPQSSSQPASAPAPDSGDGGFPPASPAPRRKWKWLVWVAAAVIYLALSILTDGWYITWILFPLAACVQGLIHACMDYKEETDK